MAWTRAALGLLAVAVSGAALVSGGSPADPQTPPALPGKPAPFLTVAVIGGGGLVAGIDAYGDIVDIRPGPAGPALVDNPYRRQVAGTVGADSGVVPLASVRGGRPLPLWRADSVRQRYWPGTNVLLTEARFGADRVGLECAAHRAALACMSATGPNAGPPDAKVSFDLAVESSVRRIHLDDAPARRIIRRAAKADRHWLEDARPLGPEAPAWARRLYERSLLVMRALKDGRSGAVAAGARDGWAYIRMAPGRGRGRDRPRLRRPPR